MVKFLPFVDVFERDIDAALAALALLVVPHRVAVEEGCRAPILRRHPHVVAGVEQTGVGPVLGIAK